MLNGLFTGVDLYLVGILLGEGPAGIYGMARQIRTPVRQVRQSFDGLLNPIIARTLVGAGPAETGAATAAAARLILALQLPILIALVFAGVPLLAWFGPDFAAGYWALLLLAGADMIQGAFGVSDLIILYRRPLAQLRITAANIVVNLIAGALLIVPLGSHRRRALGAVGVLAGALIRRLSLRAHFGISTALHYSAGPASPPQWPLPPPVSPGLAAPAGGRARALSRFAEALERRVGRDAEPRSLRLALALLRGRRRGLVGRWRLGGRGQGGLDALGQFVGQVFGSPLNQGAGVAFAGDDRAAVGVEPVDSPVGAGGDLIIRRLAAVLSPQAERHGPPAITIAVTSRRATRSTSS